MAKEMPAAKRENWIDCEKGLAILAVVYSHGVTILYQNRGLANITVFSVSLLVFMAGVTTFGALRRRALSRPSLRLCGKNLWRVAAPYFVATVVLSLALDKGFFPAAILRHLLLFDRVSPYYFVAFYLQLVLAGQPLYLLVGRLENSRRPALYTGVSVLAVAALSVLSVQTTSLFAVGGAKHLFGGTFLLLYYLGMLYGAHGRRLCPAAGAAPDEGKAGKSPVGTLRRAVPVLCCVLLALLCGYYLYHWSALFGLEPFWSNPPGLTILLYTLAIFALSQRLFLWMERRGGRVFRALLRPLALCGRHSMTVFLYHILCLGVVVPLSHDGLQLVFGDVTPRPIVHLTHALCFVVVVAIPVAGGALWDAAKARLRARLRRSEEKTS